MNYEEFSKYFEGLTNGDIDSLPAPFNNPLYQEFTKGNWGTMTHWFEAGSLLSELSATLKRVSKPQTWLVITEAWSADSAQNLPFIVMAARENPLISLNIELRDSEPYTIDKYLTNGTKSIPKLVVRDEHGVDIGTWGARPAACQALFLQLIKDEAPFEKLVTELQNWYSSNKGDDVQKELNALLIASL